jgi:hypothetical protein
MKKREICLTSIFIILNLVFLFSGCNRNPYSDNLTRLNGGAFITQDLNAAQYEIPYKIVLPIYLPIDMESKDSYFVIICEPQFDSNYNKIKGIIITYRNKSEDKMLVIYENYLQYKMITIYEKGKDPININGINITLGLAEPRTGNADLGSVNDSWGLAFYWDYDDIRYRIDTYSISEKDSLKIIESMIKQLK